MGYGTLSVSHVQSMPFVEDQMSCHITETSLYPLNTNSLPSKPMDAPEDRTVHGAAEVVLSQDWALETDTPIASVIIARQCILTNLIPPARFKVDWSLR